MKYPSRFRKYAKKSSPKKRSYRTKSVSAMSIPRALITIDRRVVPMAYATSFNCTYNSFTGINNSGPAITFAVCQQGLLYSQVGFPWTQQTFNNASASAAIFQEYRIRKWEIQAFYSTNSNNNGTSTVSPPAGPMVYSVIDREDAVDLTSTNSALEYASCTIHNFVRGDFKIVDNSPTVVLAADNAASFLGTIQAAGLRSSQWLSCGSNSSSSTPPTIPHGNIKLIFDPQTVTANVITGYVTFVCRAIIEYRGID